MPETINLIVQENSHTAALGTEQAAVIRAVSPTVEIERDGSGVAITVTDYRGSSSAELFDGPQGPQGERGPQGVPGQDGQPGRDAELRADRVTSLTETPLSGGAIVEAVGIPVYVSDVSQYSQYGLTEAGWYTFARIAAPADMAGASATVTGAVGYIAGSGYVDVAVRFGVTAMSQAVTVSWGGQRTETFVFRATDLAVRNLDYRTTFYLYDLDPFVTWTYALTTDATFVSGSHYYTESGGVYTEAIEGTDWTAGDAIPADTYYKHSKARFEGMTRNVTYKLDTVIDCAVEIALPLVEDDGYGAWFEIQMRYSGSFSTTLIPADASVKIGTAQTQVQTAGINVLDLQYTHVGGVAMWTLLNTHSNIPT